jgi:mRNA deadenylase 3'-5' endonuclease subunit Ccr4
VGGLILLAHACRGQLPRSHTDLTGFDYDKFVESTGLSHNLRLKSAYGNEMPYSNYTANFVGEA